jgi:serine/threonine-protein kinase RsbW
MQSLSVPAELASLRIIGELVTEAARTAGLDEGAIYRLNLAVEEIAGNIITHGYAEQGVKGDIRVSAELDEDRLVVELLDQGIAFDPTDRPLPSTEDLSRPVEQRAVGGLGILLAVRALDGFRYERTDGSNRNILEMRRR